MNPWLGDLVGAENHDFGRLGRTARRHFAEEVMKVSRTRRLFIAVTRRMQPTPTPTDKKNMAATTSNDPKHLRARPWAFTLLLTAVIIATTSLASTGRQVQDRLDLDLAAGRPVVVHVVVALCDNVNQGIVPVPEHLGNGQDPATNLYWGALYGVRTHFPRAADWTRIDTQSPSDRRILERAVFFASLPRDGIPVPVYVVADAWDGAHIREALQTYLQMAAGDAVAVVDIVHEDQPRELLAGGAAQLLAYVGHNGLMEHTVQSPAPSSGDVPARSAIVLACYSRSYFLEHLLVAGAHPLLLTRGLMAPEAYTLDAAIRAWVDAGTTEAVVEAAAQAYHRYQHCGMNGARGLFWGAP